VGINSLAEDINGNQKVMLVQVQFLMLTTLQKPPTFYAYHRPSSRADPAYEKIKTPLKILMFNDALLEHGLKLTHRDNQSTLFRNEVPS
jgi:hypothetical protein